MEHNAVKTCAKLFFELEIRIPVGEEGTRCGNVALSGAV